MSVDAQDLFSAFPGPAVCECIKAEKNAAYGSVSLLDLSGLGVCVPLCRD